MDLASASPTGEDRARRCREYLDALEEERRKIQVFQRELPLSLNLVTQTVESYRRQMAAELFTAGGGDRSGVEEEREMSSEGAPVLEEFIPIKRGSSSEADDEEEHNDEGSSSSTGEQKQHEIVRSEKKPDWLRSVQLWSPHTDPHLAAGEQEEHPPAKKPIAVEAKKPTGAFLPFRPQGRSLPPAAATPAEVAQPSPALAPPSSPNSDVRGGGKSGCSGGDEKDGRTHRKSRRCWSPELHRRFLSALQQLGGSDVATPKRIRELMKVDGLTNDEVKSHLQKYRLHSRRPSPGTHTNAPPQQVVFVGGIWMPPPPGYAAAAAAAAVTEGMPTAPLTGVYAPIASAPAPKQQRQLVKQPPQGSPSGPLPGDGRDEQSTADDCATRASTSPATSSSSRTTTASPGRRR